MTKNDPKNDRVQVSKIKIKDHHLFYEIMYKMERTANLRIFGGIGFPKGGSSTDYDKCLHNRVLQNKHFLSKMKNLKGILHLAREASRYSCGCNCMKISDDFSNLIQQADDQGDYLLHIAVRVPVRHEECVVSKLIDLFPKALELPNHRGTLPLSSFLGAHSNADEVVLKSQSRYGTG